MNVSRSDATRIPGSALVPPALVGSPPARRAGATPGPAGAEAAPEAATPTLWDLLTAEEREFFSQQLAIGPLTYRPGGASRTDAAAPTGRRLDVRG